MNRAYYSSDITTFLKSSDNEILGVLTSNISFNLEQAQKNAWLSQIQILKEVLISYSGAIYFEYSIPRMGKRIDTLLVIDSLIFVIEFKIGEKDYHSYAFDQVWDYALDLKNFHETSHDKVIAPILVATNAKYSDILISQMQGADKLLMPTRCNKSALRDVIQSALDFFCTGETILIEEWERGRYYPTPTIIEAAMSLYNNHSVEEISRSDASAINLAQTSKKISSIIQLSKEKSEKAICFVTGVPGAGKTLVGLNVATTHIEKESELYSVYLSGNGPLVKILQEALALDKVKRSKENQEVLTKKEARSQVKSFIQNVHHFRDDCIIDPNPPREHVALFDEAQRAWTVEKTSDFMRKNKKLSDFQYSEPEFLISCLDRHKDWAVVVCLVGGGQEINTGEAGIKEWINAIERSFQHWKIYISERLSDSEYDAEKILERLENRKYVEYSTDLHLSVSMRSFRAEKLSLFVKQVLDLDQGNAADTLNQINSKYPIVITREMSLAKEWLRHHARGSERFGIVVSSQAQRLKPYAIDVKSPIDPIHWFLKGKEDVRSSFYLEDVATEFHVQGLELDWACVVWDGDFQYSQNGWICKSFKGSKWQNINSQERKTYLKNAYRVLLTRARQGMVIVVPTGDVNDPTRQPKFYDFTFEYLKSIGLEVIS